MDHRWYYADRQRQQQGPADAATLSGLFRQGELDADSLVWHEGLPDWQPLSRHFAALGIATPESPPPPPGMPAPPPADASPARSATVVHAGFLQRFAAFVIDSLVLAFGFYAALAVLVLAIIAMGGFKDWDERNLPGWLVLAYFLVVAGYYVAAAFYYALQESGPHQATLGKRVLGIKVTDSFGQRLDFGSALVRWFAALLGYLTLYIGFLMAAFTERKQALHDLVAGTFVVDRWAYTETPERQSTQGSGCLVAIIAGAVLFVPMLGILAAISIPAYQDYTIRARVAEAVAVAAPAKVQMQEFIANTDRCPRDAGELGISAAGATHVAMIDTGESDGRCTIRIELAGFGSLASELDGTQVLLELQDDGQWRCSSDAPAKYLPATCR
jgi:uncharacterized RDD family membrane protein YckC